MGIYMYSISQHHNYVYVYECTAAMIILPCFCYSSQLWCSLYTEEFIASDVKTNPHSPGPYRYITQYSRILYM